MQTQHRLRSYQSRWIDVYCSLPRDKTTTVPLKKPFECRPIRGNWPNFTIYTSLFKKKNQTNSKKQNLPIVTWRCFAYVTKPIKRIHQTPAYRVLPLFHRESLAFPGGRGGVWLAIDLLADSLSCRRKLFRRWPLLAPVPYSFMYLIKLWLFSLSLFCCYVSCCTVLHYAYYTNTNSFARSSRDAADTITPAWGRQSDEMPCCWGSFPKSKFISFIHLSALFSRYASHNWWCVFAVYSASRSMRVVHVCISCLSFSCSPKPPN